MGSHLPLLADVSLLVEPRERVCVIGRNGTGKSTLLQIISGAVTPESGTVWRQPGLRIGTLAQDVPQSDPCPVFDIVSDGLDDLGDLVGAYHHAAVRVAEGNVCADADGWMAPPRSACARAGLSWIPEPSSTTLVCKLQGAGVCCTACYN
jgi:ATPase subunit of ABC transporter with duplicated ATPase domains